MSVIVAVEGASFVALRLVPPGYQPLYPSGLPPRQREALTAFLRGDPSYVTFSATQGWTVRPNAASANGLYHSNAQGFRAAREYAPSLPANQLRVMAFGDSYMHGSDVPFEDSIGERLVAHAPGIEFINASVPATAADQAFIHYLETSSIQADIVLIGFMSENIYRLITVFAPFYFLEANSLPFSKPRFVLRGDQLALLPSPLRDESDLRRVLQGDAAMFAQLGQHDYWYQTRPHRGPEDVLQVVRLLKTARYNVERALGRDRFVDLHKTYLPHSEPVEAAARVLETFYDRVLVNGSLPLIVFFPLATDVFEQSHVRCYAPLTAALAHGGYRFIDFADALTGPPADYGITTRAIHFPGRANDALAQFLLAHLERNGLLDRAAVQAAVRAERERHAGKPVTVEGLDWPPPGPASNATGKSN